MLKHNGMVEKLTTIDLILLGQANLTAREYVEFETGKGADAPGAAAPTSQRAS